jgi:hypothetical protein
MGSAAFSLDSFFRLTFVCCFLCRLQIFQIKKLVQNLKNVKPIKLSSKQLLLYHNGQQRRKQLLPKIYKTLTNPVVSYICRQYGAQKREFAATHSPTKSEDNERFAFYLSLCLQL